jgi:hypothetical protein
MLKMVKYWPWKTHVCGRKKPHLLEMIKGGIIVFNATFNNISVLSSWQSVLLVEEIRDIKGREL